MTNTNAPVNIVGLYLGRLVPMGGGGGAYIWDEVSISKCGGPTLY